MKKINKNNLRKSPEKLKRLGSMESLLMPAGIGLTDSGFSVDLTEEEMIEVMEMFQEFEGKNEKDN